jgi:outer membrane immunogenic protein
MRVAIAFLIGAGAMLGVATAYADDYFPPAGPPGNFGGLSAGVDLGAAVGGAGNVDTSGIAGGGHVGFNLQNGPIVGGVEADALLGSISGNASAGTLSQGLVTSARLRGGYAFGNLLAYGTAGGAWSSSTLQRFGYSADKTLHGYVLGIGGEYAITRMISARAEFRHYDFARATYYTPTGSPALTSGNNMLLLGLGAHF